MSGRYNVGKREVSFELGGNVGGYGETRYIVYAIVGHLRIPIHEEPAGHLDRAERVLAELVGQFEEPMEAPHAR